MKKDFKVFVSVNYFDSIINVRISKWDKIIRDIKQNKIDWSDNK